jgi:hypothetical protein
MARCVQRGGVHRLIRNSQSHAWYRGFNKSNIHDQFEKGLAQIPQIQANPNSIN